MGILLVAESEAVGQSAQFGVLLEEVMQLLAANRVDTRIPTLSQGYLVEDIVPGLEVRGWERPVPFRGRGSTTRMNLMSHSSYSWERR